MRWFSVLILLWTVHAVASAGVTASRVGDQVTLENARIRVVVDVHGGRIASLMNKTSGKDMVSLWNGGGEIGGILDDRLAWTSTPYETALSESGPDSAVVRMTAKDKDDLSIVKTVSVRGDEPVIRIDYEFTNGSQQPQLLWVRNIIVPGGAPLTDHHSYVFPLKTGLVERPFASEYVEDFAAPWSALYDTERAEGLLVAAPGLEKFYFWQGSRAFPTYEWIYPEVPAGKRLKCSEALVVVNGAKPDWPALSKAALSTLAPAVTEDAPGWIDEATRFNVTPAERDQKFWLSTGLKEGKQRLPEIIDLDLPQDEARSTYVGINALDASVKTPVSLAIDGDAGAPLRASFETSGKNTITVEPLAPSFSADFAKGTEYRVWLTADSHGKAPGDYRGTATLTVGGHAQAIPFHIKVWPVRATKARPFEVRGYTALSELAGSDVTPESNRRLDALLGAYADMGGSVFDWSSWSLLLDHATIPSRGESLADAVKASPATIALDALPQLDFSHFDPWIDIAKRHGVDRIETYLDFWDGGWQAGFLDAAVGKGRVKPQTPEADRVIVWILNEARRYFEQRGMRGFFLKISDEMPPEDVPRYNRTAEVARAGGWRPFTTVTNMIAREPNLINAMDPYCDQWQLQFFLKDDFRRLAIGPEKPAHIGPYDEVWFYYGPALPFRVRYEDAYVQPMLAAAENVQGYAWWAYQWSGTEKVVWYEPSSGAVRVGPAYLGLRDGWRDAHLYAMAVKDKRRIEPSHAASEQDGALLRLGEVTQEVYHFKTIVNLNSPIAINAARRELLTALTAPE